MKTIIPVLVLFSCALGAQPIGAGFKIGAPLNDAFELASGGDYFSDARQYIIGGSLEVRLPLNLAVEGNALYTRFNFNPRSVVEAAIGSTLIGGALISERSNSWEFPILVKYRFKGAGPVRPFVGAGPTFRRFSDVLRIGSSTADNSTGKGVVLGAGIELKLLFLRVTPELRFSRWGGQSFGDATNLLFHANRNQGQVLVGFSF